MEKNAPLLEVASGAKVRGSSCWNLILGAGLGKRRNPKIFEPQSTAGICSKARCHQGCNAPGFSFDEKKSQLYL